MTQDTKESRSATAGDKALETHVATSTNLGPPPVAPEKKKKKRKYGPGLRSVQELERGMSEAGETLAKAVSRGLTVYRKRSNKSSRKRRDGAIRDAVQNWTKAVGKTVRDASDAPYDMVKTLNSNKISKQLRGVVKLASPPMFK